jgi:hypothetical protein
LTPSDAELGGNCRILLDTDIFPHCEKGNVSMMQPKCGFQVEPNPVVWG